MDTQNMALGSGVPAHADLSGEALLRELRGPVEFRIFIWGAYRRGIGKLGVSRNEDLPDLILEGY